MGYIQPAQLVRNGDWWQPSETFSPSQLTAFENQCERAWAMRYLCGVKSARIFKGAMLGTLIHFCLECYLRGQSVYDATLETAPKDIRKQLDGWDRDEAKQRALLTAAQERALVTVPHMPPLADIPERWIESVLDIDSRLIRPDLEPVKLFGKIDLRYKRAGLVYVQDHKSTKSWDYVPWVGAREALDLAARTPGADVEGRAWAWSLEHTKLLSDPQTVFYPLDCMLRFGTKSIWCRWNYTITDPDKRPQAKPYDFEVTLDELWPRAQYWYGVADRMRLRVRAARAGWRVDLDNWPLPRTLQAALADPAAYGRGEIDVQCSKYGGCVYRVAAGGPCSAPVPDDGSWLK